MSDDLRQAAQRSGSFWQTLKAVAWSFFGVRKSSDYAQDVARINPVHVIVAGVIAALASSPELEIIKRDYQAIFLEKCRHALEPFAAGAVIARAGLRAMLGAAEAVSHAAALGEITPVQAQEELCATIVAMVERARASTSATQ